MFRRRGAVALIIAMVTSTATFVYLVWSGESTQVVVAARDIRAGGRIDENSVRLAGMNRRAVHPSAYRHVEEVVGRYAIDELAAGEQVMRHRVAAGGHGGLVAGLSPDLRAMFIPVQAEHTAVGLVEPGGMVDVICVWQESKGSSVARCVLGSVSVVATAPGEARGLADSGSGESRGVVVAVTPGDAEKLAFCLENGRVYLAAVPFGGSAQTTPGVRWEDLVGPVSGDSP
ncbi:MAG: Flp pilus assembly protein CpaB [Firmicutes bacterium]|nr:Flp pilus assembly protein CpaB [Bacillota bacterium]